MKLSLLWRTLLHTEKPEDLKRKIAHRKKIGSIHCSKPQWPHWAKIIGSNLENEVIYPILGNANDSEFIMLYRIRQSNRDVECIFFQGLFFQDIGFVI